MKKIVVLFVLGVGLCGCVEKTQRSSVAPFRVEVRPGIVSGRFYTNATDVCFSGDVGFVDAARGDFRLREDSPVYRRIPDFRPIPFEKIGLLTSE